MARVLIVGGADRGLSLARALSEEGHAVRVVAAEDTRRADIEAAGAECFVGTPNRLATLRGALEHVTVACWLFAEVGLEEGDLARDLHGSRLEQFLSSAIDSTLRGFVYETPICDAPSETFARGERIVLETARHNSIPVEVLRADPVDVGEWLARAQMAVRSLLEGGHRDG